MNDAKNDSQNLNSKFSILQIFNEIDDPRKNALNFRHPLTTILFITIVCSLCGSMIGKRSLSKQML